MALWNKIICGFNGDEETVNFGARRVAERDGSLFETSTIATIQTDGEVSEKVNILTSVEHNQICIAIDKSITVFKDHDCKEILLNVNFASPITQYCVSEDSTFLFVILENGFLHCLNLSVSGKLVFSKNILQRDVVVKMFMINEEKTGSTCIMLVTKTGSIYKISGFNYTIEALTATKSDEDSPENANENITCEQVYQGFPDNEVIWASARMAECETEIIMACTNSLFTWPSTVYMPFMDSPYKYKKVQFLKTYNALLCLRTDGKLSLVCPRTLLGTKVYHQSVTDFTIIGYDDNNSCQILMLSALEDENMHNLRVVSFPGFEEKFEIKVAGLISLIEVIQYSDEGILFMEFMKRKNDAEYPDTIRIQTISENVPEHRLQRLITRGNYDAAESFARNYNLSLEPVYYAKAAQFSSEIITRAKQEDYRSTELDNFIEILDKIQDIRYVAECCCKTLIPRYKDLRELNLYGRKRIMENNEKTENANNLDSFKNITSTLRKLETFNRISGWQRKDHSYDEATFNEWIRFSRTNLMDEFKTHLRLGDLETAALIWARHLPGTETVLSSKLIAEIFAIVPKESTLQTLWPWIKHFVPALLSAFPAGIGDVTLWGCTKIKSLEQSHRSSWPQVGIEFIDMFIELLHFEKNSQLALGHEGFSSQNSAAKQLLLLKRALSDLQKLKQNYRLSIPLAVYYHEPIEVCQNLLSRIPIHLIPEFIDTFLKQYMLNNSLEDDTVLSFYIQRLIRHSKSWWSGMEEAPWERRAVAIISLIRNIECKLRITLNVLKKAPVPWSSTMIEFAEKSSNFDHALATEIRTESNYVTTKVILKRYGYERIGINDNLIRRIVKVAEENMIAHIDHLTKHDRSMKEDAFAYCINYHLSRGNLNIVMDILYTLDDSALVYCCLRIVNYVRASFTLKDIPEDIKHHIGLFRWVKMQIEALSKKSNTHWNLCNQILFSIRQIEPVYFINKEFNIRLTFSECQMKKDKILEDFARQLCSDSENAAGGLDAIREKLFRLADLLQIERLRVISILIKETKDPKILEYFKRNKGKLYFSAKESKYVNEVCFSALRYTNMDANVSRIINDLCQAAFWTAPGDEISYCVLAKNSAALYCHSFQYYHGNSYDKKEGALNSNWGRRVYPMYKDIATDYLALPILQDTVALQRLCLDRSILGKEATDSDNSPSELLSKFLEKIRSMELEHQELSLLKIINTVYHAYCTISDADKELLAIIRTILDQLIKTLLKKVISARTFDLQLGLSCLVLLPEQEALKYISAAQKLYLTHCNRHLAVSTLGCEYFRLTKNKRKYNQYNYLKSLHNWAQRLSKYSISYKDILCSDSIGKREVLETLINCRASDIVTILEDFCIAFGFNVTDCLLLYLETLMQTWQPTLNVINSSGKKKLEIPDDEVEEIRRKCFEVAEKISDKQVLKDRVRILYSKLNFYHYELFIIIMDLLEDEDTIHRNLISFLQNYTRVGSATTHEYQEWTQRHPGHTSLPQIAEWRLPYLRKIELYSFIESELNLSTYKEWLRFASALKLEPDLICTLAVKGEISRVWKDVNIKSKSWSLSPVNTTLLHDIKQCIEYMCGPDAKYCQLTALYYVVNHTPPGADLVAAAEECLKYAEKCAECAQCDKRTLEKIKMKYLRFASEHILRTHGLAVDRYLDNTQSPEKLIKHLYADDSIPQRYRSVTDHRPDINSAVNAFGQLYGINVMKLRLNLLHEWLQPDMKAADITDILTESEEITNHDENFLRACYMLEFGDITLSANLLINIGFADSNEDYSPESRYRALQVLHTILDVETLERLTKRSLTVIRHYIRSLKYVARLATVDLMHSRESFENCSKEELVNTLWATQFYSPRGLIIMADICIDFELYEYSLWDKILKQMAKLSMVAQLKRILEVLHTRNVDHLVNSIGYSKSWQVLILKPFETMDMQPSIEQIDDCVESLRLLHSCPISEALQFSEILDFCFLCRQPHLAAALLPFLNDSSIEFVVQTIEKEFDISKVIDDLKKLRLSGVLLVADCQKILQRKV